ncbi:FRG domain-containing protein [Mucilaginibacter sp. Bleaf8]|uniref:FRG domain-containing protein n=1 Tax=Mucilaginibacter sp. Bleaf8 TaxID=2834430 RepID=UPI001BCC3D5D|nr:FRG domain-containing protein [Mucilaginibacter sp. Bleaf8]MBS7564962.1 FRG domain-containing protein [Mucilaginibacter sp. Bleaf8]
MRELEISTIEEYLNLIKESKAERSGDVNDSDFLFRGQTVDSPLIPKLGRLKARGELLEVERLLLQEFKRTNPLLIEQHRPMDDWDYLTLGQHFGLPTRLLDWSNNALTALWFATGNIAPEREPASAYSVIWILMPTSKDFDLNLEATHPFEVPETRIIRPRIIKQRINNQSGVFSVTSSQDLLDKRSLQDTDSFNQKLIKVKIPCSKWADIRDDLNVLGVNAFTIFPELEGLCTYLQWRYFE